MEKFGMGAKGPIEIEIDDVASGDMEKVSRRKRRHVDVSSLRSRTRAFSEAFTKRKDAAVASVKKVFERPKKPRTIPVTGDPLRGGFPSNRLCNQKYSVLSFIPLSLFEQFRQFNNLYFLFIALSQLIPALRVGYLFTYVAPLAFVVCLSMAKECLDDVKRFIRDRACNKAQYRVMVPSTQKSPSFISRLLSCSCFSSPSSGAGDESGSFRDINAEDIKVGMIIEVVKDQRVPADLVLLRTSEQSGGSFIRTDQLDGETDWKLRRAVGHTQHLDDDEQLLELKAEAYIEAPRREIYSFVGTFKYINSSGQEEVESLSLENTIWSSTVVASGNVLGLVIYTGTETRSAMNISQPTSKFGILDKEVNNFSKLLCVVLVLLSVGMVVASGFTGIWWLNIFRFIVLFSSIIPISLRVNLDVAKIVYSSFIMSDPEIPGTIVRNTGIPEELGRISFLLTDKTGTLTQNEMIFKKLHLGTISFARDSLSEIAVQLRQAYSTDPMASSMKVRKTGHKKVQEAIRAIALCHNVTPTYDDPEEDAHVSHDPKDKKKKKNKKKKASHLSDRAHPEEVEIDLGKAPAFDDLKGNSGPRSFEGDEEDIRVDEGSGMLHAHRKQTGYQASSPDEIALVKFSESVGIRLVDRTFTTMSVVNPLHEVEEYEVLDNFPFTSDRKRMGIVLRDKATGQILFMMKGADSVMIPLVHYSDWLDEECGNMAREGLRTLVFAQRSVPEEEWNDFRDRLHQAKTSLVDRDQQVNRVIESLEKDLHLIGLTGVEDKLQEDVKGTLETLRNAGIKVWMLTGDKVETATCIAISSKLVSRTHSLFTITVKTVEEAQEKLETFADQRDTALIIDGFSLQLCLDNLRDLFFEVSSQAPCVVCCRCSPTQKESVVKLMRQYNPDKQTCAIGDGGNDVSMIQAAHIGVGIEGKEGKQASLAADISVLEFRALQRLLLWHGRTSYQRSARLSQFVIHRGLIISFIQAIFSAIYFWATIAVYTGMLLVGYSTFYTMLPVLALILDEDVSEQNVFVYPELYRELQKGRALSLKTFLIWVLISVYQAAAIMIMSLLLFEDNMLNIVSITFTALILAELSNIALSIRRWKLLIIMAEVLTFGIYFISIVVLPTYFDISFISTYNFWIKVTFVTAATVVPVFGLRFIARKINPPQWAKLR